MIVTDGSDYTGVTRTITFTAGERVAFVPVDTTNDRIAELSEDFFAFLSNPSAGLTVGDADRATVNIADNDSEQIRDSHSYLTSLHYVRYFRSRG